MNTKEPIVIGGKTIGRFRASWLLCKETFRFLCADPEVMAVPFMVGLVHLFLFGFVIFLYVMLLHQGIIPDTETLTVADYGFVFAIYILSAFAVSVTNATIAHIVAVRANGGNATLGQGFAAAFSKAGALFTWSVITATVGLLLRAIAERSQLLGRIVVAVLGAAWSVTTYFVIQAIVLEGRSAPEGIGRSGQVFKSVWGESLVTNFSLSLIFIVIYLVIIFGGVGLMVLVASSPAAFLGMFGLMLVTVFVVALAGSAMESILKTLLFIYATNSGSVQGFNQELLERMLVQNRPASPVSFVDAPPPTSTPQRF